MTMRRLSVYETVSVDGYFTDRNGDMSWAYTGEQDTEWNDYVAGNASGGGMLLFGRVTYEMMASYWPTPAAMQAMPVVAERMNSLAKVVFSRTLRRAAWQNTTLVNGDLAAAVRDMKAEPGPDMTILGSGSVVSQLARAGLIDDFQIVVKPIVLGAGRTLFENLPEKLALRRTGAREFGNGNVVLHYEPARG